ncbi:MAG: Gfo/Idh/MocA family oxidoreductase [Planctomycetota bacterium]
MGTTALTSADPLPLAAESRASEPRTSDPSAAEPRSRTRVAVVGAGFIADFHLEILAATPGVELVGVLDVARARAEHAARRYGVPHATDDLDELASFGVDVAHVLVPPDLHGPVVEGLLTRGIGVFVEKPLAPSIAEAERLVALAAEHGVPLAVNHNATFHPAFRRLLDTVRSGAIGSVEHVQVTLSVPLRQLDAGDVSHWMFREPRNIVFEQAIHPFSQLVELLGACRTMDVSNLGERRLAGGVPFYDRWLLAAKAERGTAELYLAFGQAFTKSTVEVLGSDGRVTADLHHDLVDGETKTLWLDFWNSYLAGSRRARQLGRDARRGLFGYLAKTIGLGPRTDAFFVGMRASIQTFHAELLAGAPFSTGGEHALATIRWAEAAVRDLPPAPEPPRLLDPTPARAGEIVVLGGTGFIGRRTLRALFERGLPTTVGVRRRHALPDLVTEAALDGRLRVVDVDLASPETLERAVRGARVVLHLATGGGATWEDVERNMVGGTTRVAEACLAERVERLVYVSSTAALYLGADCGTAFVGDGVGPDPKVEERGIYARGKAEAERALLRLHRERGLPVTIVRPAIVVGEGTPMQHSGYGLWVRDNHCVGWGTGDAPVPLVHADDVADALARLAAFEGHALDGKALNLAARSTLSPKRIVAHLAHETGRALTFHPRELWFSQLLEIGKWIVKRVGGRQAPFPSYRDLKSRAMVPELTSETAREVLGWQPEDDGERLLARILRD